MIKSLSAWSACALMGLSSGQAKDNVKRDTAAWLDAALAGEVAAVPAEASPLEAGDVQAEQAKLWKAYTEASTRAGWDKALLPVPKTIEKIAADGKKPQLKTASLKSGEHEMPYLFMAKGEKPATGWPMFICLHGGGQHKVEEAHGWDVNTREWQAQMSLTARVYNPEGLYFIPRMADDRLGRWWHKHNIDIFTGMIRHAILFNDVDPNKIYIMGISQGGYGSCHLAPFMADLFAAAGPMAGGMMTVTENLRNLPFRSDIGENDTMYKRIKLAQRLHDAIDAHRAKDPEGYENVLAIQKGRGHGIDYSLSPGWLATHTRNPHPDRIVWRCHQKDGIYRSSFYWLSLTHTPEKGEFEIVATLDKSKNLITITAEEVNPAKEKGDKPTRKPLTASQINVHLNDTMLDLDKEVMIQLNGKQAFKGMVKRSRGNILRNLVKRGDINYAFPAEVTVGGNEKTPSEN
jgi:S-formylglutathione hydrolase FrmB